MTKEITFSDIEEKLAQREGYEEIKKAYYYALDQHKGMKRLSGDDYITHP